jgi:hypothetical protein
MSLGVVCYESKNMGSGRLKERVKAVVHMMEAADWVGGVLAGRGGRVKIVKLTCVRGKVAPESFSFSHERQDRRVWEGSIDNFNFARN